MRIRVAAIQLNAGEDKAANIAAALVPSTDFAGNARPAGNGPDMGAIETGIGTLIKMNRAALCLENGGAGSGNVAASDTRRELVPALSPAIAEIESAGERVAANRA